MARKRNITAEYAYTTLPSEMIQADDVAANCAHFLLANGSSIFGCWIGRLRKADQLALFGIYLGKGVIFINGERDQVTHTRKVCFGTDWDSQTYPMAVLGR